MTTDYILDARQESPGVLRRAGRAGLTLPRALAGAGLRPGAAALLTSPSAYLVLDWDGAVCRDASGHTPGLSDVFEARLFDGDMELRWLQRDPDGSGDAVVVAEAADRVSAWVDAGDLGMTTRADVSYVDAWDNPYLLWGRRGPEQPDVGGWATFTSARIGSLTVPVAVASGRGAAQLVSREYMALDSAGNAYVVDERLCRFEAAPEPSEGKSGSPGSAGTSGQGVR